MRIRPSEHKARPGRTSRPVRARGRRGLPSHSMGLLDGKHIIVTGVLTDASLAFGVAKLAQEEGAEVVLTGAGRALSLTERTARKLPEAGARSSSSTSPSRSTSVSVRDAVAEPVAAGRRRAALDRLRPRGRASATTSWPRSGTTSPSRCTCRRTR